MSPLSLLLLLGAIGASPSALAAGEPDAAAATATPAALADQCLKALKALPGKSNDEALRSSCARAQQLNQCVSEKGVNIFHIDVPGKKDEKAPKKILVFALIHGDEFPAGSVARSWIERLAKVEPRNEWRIVPVLNPDGVKQKTRYNANGVDLNRNFPTENWEKEALEYWEKKMHKDKRRFPGSKPNSEKETHCALAHIDDFQPDLILSIHTPYNVLDFDGPDVGPPRYKGIPWRNLGNYPGSLGRYMWVDRKKPILTVELGPKNVIENLEQFSLLQDISGDIAIKSEKMLREKKEAAPKGEPKKDGKK
jgi:protein MpaA